MVCAVLPLPRGRSGRGDRSRKVERSDLGLVMTNAPFGAFYRPEDGNALSCESRP